MNKLTHIYRYSIKSTMPHPLNESVVEKRGLEFDRVWAVFDENGQALTAREYPVLLDVETDVSGQEMLISYQGKPIGSVPLESSSEDALTLKIFSYDAKGLPTNPAMNDWFTNLLGIKCQLLFQDKALERFVLEKHGGSPEEIVSFADQCPILLATQSSLADLNSKLSKPIDMNRFRPNFVVSETNAWDEDTWQKIRIGEVEFKVNQACIRCSLTTIDPLSKMKDANSEPLRTMASFRKGPQGGVVFGMHLTPMTTGRVKVDDELVVLN